MTTTCEVAVEIRLKRVYDAPSPEDGLRVLVDRIWPRGLSKERAAVDLWVKELAPSAELRKWFGHETSRWDEFRRQYVAELGHSREAAQELRKRIGEGRATLLYAARDEEHNNAVVLKDFLYGG